MSEQENDASTAPTVEQLTKQVAALEAERDELAKQNEDLAAQLKAVDPGTVKGPTVAVIELTEDTALGNGTRKAGTQMAKVQPGKDIDLGEVIQAFGNPHRFNVRVKPAK